MLTSISGYPEWLPEDRLVELRLVEMIQRQFELYGFMPIETRAVEPLDVLLKKGETDKEIYLLSRLQDSETKDIGLHFDMTVPFARYVSENFNSLSFPFRRYQIQKAWRGERPGQGRFREFLQADIDIVDSGSLPIYADYEVLQTVVDILRVLPIPSARLYINNRKLLQGFYQGLGIDAVTETLRTVDKLDKIGEDGVRKMLTETVGLSAEHADKCLEIGRITGADSAEIRAAVESLGVTHDLLDEGLAELSFILDNSSTGKGENPIVADLSIARGLDYYTGTVVETKFVDFPKYPTIVAGGRYDNLVSVGNTRLPGVGVSMGITRILGLVLNEGLLKASRKSPSSVLIALVSEEQRGKSLHIARKLRARGVACEVFGTDARFGAQIGYAVDRGIPYVWFPDGKGDTPGEVRELATREQTPADPDTWTPDESHALTIAFDEDAYESLKAEGKYA